MKELTKDLLSRLLEPLSERDRDIITLRYGLDGGQVQRLQRIGDKYNVTRERIRQIESKSLEKIKKNPEFGNILREPLDRINKLLESYGKVISEEHALEALSEGDASIRPLIRFTLILAGDVDYHPGDNNYHPCWFNKGEVLDVIQKGLNTVSSKLDDKSILSEQTIVKLFMESISDEVKGTVGATDGVCVKNWITFSKNIISNPLEEWGSSKNKQVACKTIRDCIKLVLRHNEPMHFEDIKKEVERLFNRVVNKETCHNELVCGDDFVKVGRGIYTLKDKLKFKGDLVDSIKEVIKEKGGSASARVIIDAINNERFYKETTIRQSLGKKDFFAHNVDKTYSIK